MRSFDRSRCVLPPTSRGPGRSGPARRPSGRSTTLRATTEWFVSSLSIQVYTTNITLFFKLSCYLRRRDDTFRSRNLFSRRRRFGFGPIRLVRIFGAATALSGGRNVLPDCPRSGFETILHFSYLWCRNGTFTGRDVLTNRTQPGFALVPTFLYFCKL